MQAQIQQTIVQATPDVDQIVQPGGTAISHALTTGVSLDSEMMAHMTIWVLSYQRRAYGLYVSRAVVRPEAIVHLHEAMH